MKELTKCKLKSFFPNHTLPQVKNFTLLLTCILQCRTVNLYKCKDYVPNLCRNKSSGANSNYTRLIRFFKVNSIATFISGIQQLLLFQSSPDLSYLIVDRSNWKRGTKNINLLTIGTLLNNTFSPLHWVQLNKGGSSNLTERTSLIEGLLSLLQKAGKSFEGSILLADREFIGQDWFMYLSSKKLSFVIRLREKLYFDLQTHTGKKNFVKVVC
jgi:Transposase DDE domain